MYFYHYQREIKASTWNRDSHGLFDYDSKNVIKDNIRINESGLNKLN